MARLQILPGTGRWQPEGLTEGAHLSVVWEQGPLHRALTRAVPLPVPGRI